MRAFIDKMEEEIKQPTVDEVIEKLERDGGFLKGKGDGRVHWKPDDGFDIVERRLENGE